MVGWATMSARRPRSWSRPGRIGVAGVAAAARSAICSASGAQARSCRQQRCTAGAAAVGRGSGAGRWWRPARGCRSSPSSVAAWRTLGHFAAHAVVARAVGGTQHLGRDGGVGGDRGADFGQRRRVPWPAAPAGARPRRDRRQLAVARRSRRALTGGGPPGDVGGSSRDGAVGVHRGLPCAIGAAGGPPSVAEASGGAGPCRAAAPRRACSSALRVTGLGRWTVSDSPAGPARAARCSPTRTAPSRPGPRARRALGQRRTAHVGHHHVGHHDVDASALALEHLERLAGRRRLRSTS